MANVPSDDVDVGSSSSSTSTSRSPTLKRLSTSLRALSGSGRGGSVAGMVTSPTPVNTYSSSSSPATRRLSSRLNLEISDLAALAYKVNGGKLFAKMRARRKKNGSFKTSRSAFAFGILGRKSSSGGPWSRMSVYQDRWFYLIWNGHPDSWRMAYSSDRLHADQVYRTVQDSTVI